MSSFPFPISFLTLPLSFFEIKWHHVKPKFNRRNYWKRINCFFKIIFFHIYFLVSQQQLIARQHSPLAMQATVNAAIGGGQHPIVQQSAQIFGIIEVIIALKGCQ